MPKVEVSVLYPCGAATRSRASSWFGRINVDADTKDGCPVHKLLCKGTTTEGGAP